MRAESPRPIFYLVFGLACLFLVVLPLFTSSHVVAFFCMREWVDEMRRGSQGSFSHGVFESYMK